MPNIDAPRSVAAIQPLALPVPQAAAFAGISRSELYRRLAAGDLCAVKVGKRTLILTESLREFVASLPRATFHSASAVRRAAA
jgi:excisionase family DNA binding protein